MGVGSLIGSMSLAFTGNRRPLLRLILGGAVVFVAFEFLLGLTRNPLAVFPLIAVVGLASMVMVNTINVTVQHHVPDELRGRVMSLYVTVFAGSAPLGGFFAGVVAELWGAPVGFILGAVISIVFIALVGWQLVLRGRAWADEPVTSLSPSPDAAPAPARAVNE
jgi:MFS family permease